ncbi:DUF938 domain-containing protein [Variovorax sp. UC122_21]|uniref:DUF938 domain-containing protein n=1 Tax=Variovorax sp. UC122_21 TaxID=3374554 RepID=UPI003756F8B9
MSDLSFSPAAERNKQPILERLLGILGEQGAALEIASGTGQHAEWFATALRGWTWQTSDADARTLLALARRVEQAGLPGLRPPVLLDVMDAPWPSQGEAFAQEFDAIYCANMLHISPWSTCTALMQGAARHLRPEGLLVTYGPYFEEGTAPAPSNLAFDQSLRERDPTWGIRSLKDVQAQARAAGLRLRARHEMPANNLLLVFGR